MSQDKQEICRICNLHISDDFTHRSTELHAFNFLLWQWNKYKKALVKDRHGIEITIKPDIVNNLTFTKTDFNKNKGRSLHQITPIQLELHNNTLEFSCIIKNNRKENVLFTSAILLYSNDKPYFFLYDPQHLLDQNKILEMEPKSKYTVKIRFSLNDIIISSFKVGVTFNFQTINELKPDTFSIARSIVVHITEETAENEKITASPFTRLDWSKINTIISCTHRPKNKDQFEMPEQFKQIFKHDFEYYSEITSEEEPLLHSLASQMEPGYVTAENYRYFFRNVLWLEEMEQTDMLQQYNMENVCMKFLLKDTLELQVPGLAEKRPSVVAGDLIQIRVHDDHTAYEGVVKRVFSESIEIAYLDNEILDTLRTLPDLEMDVRFILNRLQFERMQEGILQTYTMQKILFPAVENYNTNLKHTKTLHDFEFINKKILNNIEQKTAVTKILNGCSQRAPYIVYGPPGTGKTDTIVEAILQIKNKTQLKILICAPANAACDMLAMKLIELGKLKKDELLREHSETADISHLSQTLREFSNIQEDGAVEKTSDLAKYRIVVTTLILIGRYARRFHPDVLFIDEAAQAKEPECDIAIGMVSNGLQIVLAGDPNQLGPSCSSKVAVKYGLDKSLLERLMELELYKTNNPNFITMLKQNYRSHELILRLPNKFFYNNELIPMSREAAQDPVANTFVYHKLPGLNKKRNKNQILKGKAIEFCAVLSKEQREGRSPSYFNVEEMQMVLKYVQALTNLQLDENYKVTANQIGVVTPYIRQAYKIRYLLTQHNFADVEIGTTETFQGREKRIIIISTVRAQHDLLLHDKKYNLGFVRNEKRLNVALTRAKSKLIIIGNPQVLGTDDNWLQLIELCREENAYFGAPYVQRTRQFRDDITNKIRNVAFQDSQNRH